MTADETPLRSQSPAAEAHAFAAGRDDRAGSGGAIFRPWPAGARVGVVVRPAVRQAALPRYPRPALRPWPRAALAAGPLRLRAHHGLRPRSRRGGFLRGGIRRHPGLFAAGSAGAVLHLWVRPHLGRLAADASAPGPVAGRARPFLSVGPGGPGGG